MMETIYDFNPTKSELRRFGLGSRERYCSVFGQDTAYQHIAFMLYFRGDNRYSYYANKLPPNRKLDFLKTIGPLE